MYYFHHRTFIQLLNQHITLNENYSWHGALLWKCTGSVTTKFPHLCSPCLFTSGRGLMLHLNICQIFSKSPLHDIYKHGGLRSKDPKFGFCCTHPRTSRDHNSAFLWGVRRHILKFATLKVGRTSLDQIGVFQNHMLFQWGKINPKLIIFNLPCTIVIWLSGDFWKIHCGGFCLFWHGCNQLEF